MQIDEFLSLIKSGFDVSFNYNDVFYTISVIEENQFGKEYGIGADNGFVADFKSLDSIPEFLIEDKMIKDIIMNLDEEEIYY